MAASLILKAPLSRRGICVLMLMMRTPIRPLNLILLVLLLRRGGTIRSFRFTSHGSSAAHIFFKTDAEIPATFAELRVGYATKFRDELLVELARCVLASLRDGQTIFEKPLFQMQIAAADCRAFARA